MKKSLFLISVVAMVLSYKVVALNSILRQKYPFLVLNNDHGILIESDLTRYAKDMYYEKFSKKLTGLNYWQCFPRENISVTLRDMGYSAEEFDPDDTVADLKITARSQPNVFHSYYMRRAYPISAYQEHFTRWQKLMKGEKYVCIAGSFGHHEKEIKNEAKREESSWVFDRIKTRKGSDSYFVN